MPWLEQHPTSGRFKICFRWSGQQFKKTVKTTDRGEALAVLKRVEENINLAERGRLEVPMDADIATFFVSDGKLPHKPKVSPPPRPMTLGELRDLYLQAYANGAIEANSLQTVTMYLGHAVKTLGAAFAIQAMTLDDLQRHVAQRGKKKYRGRPLSPVTLRKEVASFRACWNWGVQAGKLKGSFPNRGLTYPKVEEKPPFQTWAEIERQIACGGLSERQQQELWDCLFLTLPQIEELLAYVKGQARQPFLYPMFVFAAHTGARRSEMLRVRIADVNLDGQTVLVREKKRVRGVRSTRRVPLSPLLLSVLKEWLAVHPGGQHLFCLGKDVIRSKSRRSGPAPVTRDQAHDHLKRTLAGSKWEVLRGWHLFRHSYCSNLVAAGVDQRLIDAWVGHTTEEMRKRYRHLIPNQERQIIQAVFGQVTALTSPPSTSGTATGKAEAGTG
jgi:integrase